MRLLKVSKDNFDQKKPNFILMPDTPAFDKKKRKTAINEGRLYRITPSKEEVESYMNYKNAGRIIALWKAGWDITSISLETSENCLHIANIIEAYIRNPDLYERSVGNGEE